MKACEHGPDDILEKRWGKFLVVLERGGGAVGPEGRAASPAAPRKPYRGVVQDKKKFDGAHIWWTL